MLKSNQLPFDLSDMPNFQHIARSYLEDISMITQMQKPSTPQLEEEFTALLRSLEQRHKIKVLAISRGFRELVDRIRGQCGDPTMPLTIRDAQKVCAAHYGEAAPSVLVHTPNPDIQTTYVEEFLHRNIYELLKNAMRATCEEHLFKGSPISISTSPSSSKAGTKKLPPIKLVLVDGGEDVTIKISDEGGGMALSEIDKIWSYVHSGNPSNLRKSNATLVSKTRTTTTPYQPSAPNTSTLSTSSIVKGHVSRADEASASSSISTPQPADSMTVMGGLASEAKDYLELPLNGSGHGLPLARLIARYFGGDLSLIAMEGYGTDSYLSLYRNDDHLENFPEVDEEMAAEVDVFLNELLEEPGTPSQEEASPSMSGHGSSRKPPVVSIPPLASTSSTTRVTV
ncbi:[Pyruvate dehydrogenase (acetyl-transferring)] kinase isozyme 4 [Actinomortierella ambigua]|nr:[Pyruvate dehydrogenase (acetyl-transferring)] kinase isozyme 4 [Actinomortierella ambigua]